MAFAFEQVNAVYFSGTSGSVSLAQPCTAGNVIVVFLVKDDDVAPTSTTADDPGWTTVGQTMQSQIYMAIYYKLCDGTEQGFGVIGDSEEYSLYIAELSGGDPTNPFFSAAVADNGTANTTFFGAPWFLMRIPDIPAGVLYLGLLGTDRNCDLGPDWRNPDGTEPDAIYNYDATQGLGANSVSMEVFATQYGINRPFEAEYRNSDRDEEYGHIYLLVSPPVVTPVISLPTGTPETLTQSTARITGAGFTTDVTTGTGYWYLSSSSTPPSATDLIAGTGAIQSGSDFVSGLVVTFADITGLSPNTQYFLHYIQTNISAQSNILSINVSTPAFSIPLTFSSLTQIYYTGANAAYKTTYQNTGTAWAVLTTSATPPPQSDIINNTNQAWLDRRVDTSWTTSADPNLFFQLSNQAEGGVSIFENSTAYVHALIEDGANGTSDTVTHAFTTRHRFVLSNFVAIDNTVDSITFEYDLLLNESTTPRAVFVLNQDPTPLTPTQINAGTWDYDSGFLFLTAADGTYQFVATGLEALKIYYLHVYYYDQDNLDYNTATMPVISPAATGATALLTEALTLTANSVGIYKSVLNYQFIEFGTPARNITTITEQLVTDTNQASIDRGRDPLTVTESLVLNENQASISFGGSLSIVTATEQLALTESTAIIGRGQTAFTVTEQLLLTENLASVAKGRNANTVTESLLFDVSQGTVTKQVNRLVSAQTEQLALNTNTAVVLVSTRPQLLLTENQAEVQKDRLLQGVTEQLVLGSNNALVQQNRDVLGQAEILALEESTAQIVRDRLAEAQTEEILLQELVAKVGQGQAARGATEQLIVSESAAVVQKDYFVNGGTEVLGLGTSTANIRTGRTARGNTEQIVFSDNDSTIRRDRLTLTAVESLILDIAQSVVGQGQTVRGATELLVAQGTPAPLRKDRLVSTLSESETHTLIVAKGKIGRGVTVRTEFERIILQTTQATFKRGSNILGQVETLFVAVSPAFVGRGRTITTITEDNVFQLPIGIIGKTTDRRVVCATETLTLLPQSGTIVQDTVLNLPTEQLILGATRAIVQQIRRAEGPGLPFYGKEGIEILVPTLKAQTRNKPISGVIVLNPPNNS